MKRIGIDVGGTNTDAVLLTSEGVVAAVKSATTQDVISGVVASLAQLKAAAPELVQGVDAVMIGTTHFTNAVVERRDLTRVGALRICLPSSASIGPMEDWPDDLRLAVDPICAMVAGGHEYDGRPIVDLDERGLRNAVRRMVDDGIRSIGITSVFSPLNDVFEERARVIAKEECTELTITCSHEVGRIGLLERENVTLMNASLAAHGKRTVAAFKEAIARSGIDAPFYLTQNDGTVLLAELAARFPVFSFASGPTNSMRGAAYLSGLDEAIVLDVGGTTTDIGCLVNGFPREANGVVHIGGVRTLFQMPDLLSFGIGGGSIVSLDKSTAGPQSVGYRLPDLSLVFGGDTLTLTDIGVAAGLIDLGDRDRVKHLDRADVDRILLGIGHRMEVAIDQMKTSPEPASVVAVGGGAFLVPRHMAGVREVIHCERGNVANAIGAASALVSGEADRVITGMDRESALADAESVARKKAVEGGADAGSLKIVEVEEIPIAYLPGNARRVRVRVVGEIVTGDRALRAAE